MSKKRSYGSGTIYQKKRLIAGTTDQYEYFGDYYAQKMINGKRKTVSGKTRAEVRRKLDVLMVELSNADLQRQKKEEVKQEEIKKNGQETLKNWIKRWVVKYKSGLDDQRSIQCVVRRICKLRIAKLELQDIKIEDIQDFINEMRDEKNYADRTQEYTFTVLNDCLNAALESDYILKNPCQATSIKKPHVRKSQLELLDGKFWSKEELAKFIETYDGKHHLFNFFYLMVLTGCRKQEIAALHWDDVNWKDKILRIDTAIVVPKSGKGEEEGPTKNTASSAEIGVPDEALELLKRQRKWQMEQALKYKFTNSKNWVFTSKFGKHYSMSWLSQEFQRLSLEAGLPNITVHGLRHTTATLLRDAGVPIEKISQQLRHVNVLVTSNYYAHQTPESKQQIANVTQDIFTDVKNLNKKKAPEINSEAN